MAEALLGLVPFNGGDEANANKFPISHIDHLQDQLRRVVKSKSSPTRAEHISVSLDIRATVQFTIVEADAEDATSAANIDPALGGDVEKTPDQSTRLVRVNDAVMNQPQDNPATQRSVANNIIDLLSAVDGSAWAVRESSRGAQGWTFTYLCKDSVAAWNRQNAKSSAKLAVIGEYSLKEQDPVTTARPAFDCRGSVSIAFSKSSRSINIKYDHTPLHKTVAQMMEHFWPPPPPPPPAPVPGDTAPAADSAEMTTKTPKKTPKKRKSGAAGGEAGEGGAEGQPKKTPRKRKSEGAGANGEGQQNKRRKTSDAAPSGPEAPMVPPDYTGPTYTGPTPAEVADGQNVQTAQTKADAAVQSDVHSQTLLNVPPAEAARRRETAIRLLSEGGVDPESLSSEQFGIFANQSPDLQKESLAMFAKYGAERLRIVHPKDASTSEPNSANANASPEQSSQQASAPAPNPTETPGTSTKKLARKSDIGNASEADGKKTPKPRLSRGSCTLCRSSKTKCDKAKPTCGPCEKAGVSCEYPLEKTRASRGQKSEKTAKSAPGVELEPAEPDVVEVDSNPVPGLPPEQDRGTVPEQEQAPDPEPEQEPGPEPEQEPDPEPDPEPTPEPEQGSDNEPDEIETIDYTSNMPVANMLTPAVDPPNHDFFGAASEGLHFPQTMNTSTDNGLHPASLSHQPSSAHVEQQQQQPPTNYAQPAPQPESPQTQGKAWPLGRSSFVSDAPQPYQPKEALVPLPTYTSSWQDSGGNAGGTTRSPNMTNQATDHRSRNPVQASQPDTVPERQPSYDAIHAAAALSQVAMSQQSVSPTIPPTQAITPSQRSPFQTPVQDARAKSRTEHRSQTRTPLIDHQRTSTPSHNAVQQNLPASTALAAMAASKTTANINSMTNFNAYDTRYTGTSNDQASTKLSYEPYAAQTAAASATSTSYPPHGGYGSASNSTSSTAGASPSGHWTGSRNTSAYDANSTKPSDEFANQRQQQQQQQQQAAVPSPQSASPQSFNMRTPVSSAQQTRESTAYSQAQQQQPYGGYSTSHQQQQQHQHQQTQNWYGGGFGSYGHRSTGGSGGGGNAYGHPQQQHPHSDSHDHPHGQLGMSAGHGYGGTDGDIFDLLKTSLHPR